MPSELEPVYLLTGGDRPKIARALERLRARVGEDAVELLSAGEASGDDAVSACNALGLFGGGHRLVIVDRVERWKAPDVKAVTTYLGDPVPGTVLALVGEGVKRDSPLAKACAASGKLLVYDVFKKRLPQWVAQQFERLGARADDEACSALVEIVGDDADSLLREVEKLAVWAQDEVITADAVHALAAPGGETPGFALSDAWGRRDVAGVLRACELLLERTSGARRDELARVAGLIASHVGRVRDSQLYAAEGLSPREVAGKIRRAPYYVEKLFAQAENYSVDELRTAVVRLAALDLAVKGGSKLPGDVELERALIDITGPPPDAATSTAVR